jgi:hypothetical protein|eukprot:COSAG06_NODE_9346_length_1925_cov_1.784228_2_plen_296_part_00
MSGRWRCPFAFVPAEYFGNFQKFCEQIDRKLAAGRKGLNDMSDFYEIAKKLDESGGEHRDLTWCQVGGKMKRNGNERDLRKSQVHGSAPWAAHLEFTTIEGEQVRDVSLAEHGIKNAALAPDPDHCLHAITKNAFYEFEQKLCKSGRGKQILKQKIKQHCKRDSYDEYMDGSNWQQFLFNYEDIMIPALEEEGCGGVPEAHVLFTNLTNISVVCSKSRSDLKRHHCLLCKMSCFAYARTMERLCQSSYFTTRPINLYFGKCQHFHFEKRLAEVCVLTTCTRSVAVDFLAVLHRHR